MKKLIILLVTVFACTPAFGKKLASLSSANARLTITENAVEIDYASETIVRVNNFYFNYQALNDWKVEKKSDKLVSISGQLPAEVDFYHSPFDKAPRDIEIQITAVNGGFRFYAAPEWGNQTSLELDYLGDHFFGLSAPLQPDNRLSPDLTGSIIDVDINSEGAALRENYATAYSAFYMSTLGYGAFFDTFARGRYQLAINGKNRIHHDTGTLDWYIFPGKNGTEIHRAYFELIGAPKKVPAWGLGPVGWRDQNNGGAKEILDDVKRLTDMKMPFTSWFVDRPYSDGAHAWSKMNFSDDFKNPAEWIKILNKEFNLEFMTWVSPATFGDERFNKHLKGKFSYIDLSDEKSVAAYQKALVQQQYKHGVVGHKIDRADEALPHHEDWADGTPTPERRNKYSYLMAKTHHEVLEQHFPDNNLTFVRSATHRTQPYLSAIWGGDPRTTFEGMQGNFANAIRSSFMGFPVWGTDVGGYQGDGYIPEDLYLRWMQAGSVTGLFEIKLDGAGGSGKDRMPWQYNEKFQQRFRAILEDRMQFLPYLYSLANTSAQNGVLMKPMAYVHLQDKNTWQLWDQFYLGDAILAAPVFNKEYQRQVYLPPGQWRNFDKPAEVYRGGKWIEVQANLDTLPRFIAENSIFVTGDLFQGNDKVWRKKENVLVVHATPAQKSGQVSFNYLDVANTRSKAIKLQKEKKLVRINLPALSTNAELRVYLDEAPKLLLVNEKVTEINFDNNRVIIAVETKEDTEITLSL